MKLIIDIPTEFECDYVGDKFKDFFSRVLCDIEKGVMCGNYEKETTEMFLKAFDESVPMANIVEKLEALKNGASGCNGVMCENCEYNDICFEGEQSFKVALDRAINIVKQESEQIDKKF